MTHVHFIGIGGSGLSAIARLLMESGYEVSGSDRLLSPFAAELQNAGVPVRIGHDARHIEGADWVVRSSAITDDNPEVRASREAGIPVYKRADLLGKLMSDKTGIAVAGTHGKTTTTAMVAWTLFSLGADPSFIIGGVANNLGVNAHAGSGTAFVVEADEYDHMFLGLRPRIEVITSLEHDHPDCFPTFADMRSAFEAFVDLLPGDGSLIACGEDNGALGMLEFARGKGRKTLAYGTNAEVVSHSPHWMHAQQLKPNDVGGFNFTARSSVSPAIRVEVALQVPGEHNVLNALATLAVIALLGLSLKDGAVALANFTGTGRRFEVRGERDGVTVIDDYAHHPTEIRATLAAARARYPKRNIWAVWQPHTYSRTRALLGEFANAFSEADQVLVTEIYASREAAQEFSAAAVVRAMPHPQARFSGSLENTAEYLLKHLSSGDVLLVLSAGDADQISERIMRGA